MSPRDDESVTSSNLSMEEATVVKDKSLKKTLSNCTLIVLVIFLVLFAIIFGFFIILVHISANATRESLATKTLTALKTPPNGTIGRSIWPKIHNETCLQYNNFNGHFFVDKKAYPDICLGNRWQMDDNGLFYWEQVWDDEKKETDLCLNKGSECYRKSPTRFAITNHRVNLKQRQVYFSIKSLMEWELCLTLCPLCPTRNILLVNLDSCSGSPEQFFTLKINAYDEEFANMKYPFLVNFFGL